MKKYLLLTSISFLLMHTMLSAQNARLGFSGGVTLANLYAKVDGESDNLDSKIGGTFGVFVDVPVAEHLSFQPALNFVQKGGKDKTEEGGFTEKVRINLNYIEVPLNLLYNSNGSKGNFFIGAGPSFAMGISGKLKYTFEDESESAKVHFGNGEDDDFRGFDFGGNFITGFRTKGGFQFAVNYNYGFSNLFIEGGDGSLRNSYIGIRLGFLLNANK